MCNPEFMALSALNTIRMQNDLLEDKREHAKAMAERKRVTEELRQTEEQTKITEWADVENRKVMAATGEAEVAMAGSGVHIQSIIDTWTAQLSEVHGQESAQRRRVALFGDHREADIEETLLSSLEANKELSGGDKAMMLMTAIAQGIQAEKLAGTWDGSIFGIDIPDWMTGGTDDPLGLNRGIKIGSTHKGLLF